MNTIIVGTSRGILLSADARAASPAAIYLQFREIRLPNLNYYHII
jgi:hypothetical protein